MCVCLCVYVWPIPMTLMTMYGNEPLKQPVKQVLQLFSFVHK